MSYQVLARKWRPQNFKQMVGQEHVLKALIHALESQRLHHAYLFTGTRGVGKTTIGRILAKCLSCNSGITSEPCGQCSACTGISEGRYVDLIEIDAASRTKVEDMRELLDNVQYAPSEGRFKIYLIDEVHMLSQSSFNALLKTLEEPPEHVKFLFATTDPQKLPVTILSRCLQFNLKNMSPERIVAHLQHILGEEQVAYEDPALWALARAADGSMRDALSLTDQAIAYGQHRLEEAGVSAMLGTVDQKRIYHILEALVANRASQMLDEVAALAEFSPDYSAVLASLISILHRIAIEQAVPGVTDNAMGDQALVQAYARQMTAEDVQLYYQIALVSRKDLAITPDQRSGLEMALLRMLAFRLGEPGAVEGELEAAQPTEVAKPASANQEGLNSSSSNEPESKLPEVPESSAPAPIAEVASAVDGADMPVASTPGYQDAPPIEAYGEPSAYADEASEEHHEELKKKTDLDAQPPHASESEAAFDSLSRAASSLSSASELRVPEKNEAEISESETLKPETSPTDLPLQSAPTVTAGDQTSAPSLSDASEQNAHSQEIDKPEMSTENAWPLLAAQLGLSGMTLNLLLNMFLEQRESELLLHVEPGHYRLLNQNHEKRIIEGLQAHFGAHFIVRFQEGLAADHETPMMWRERRAAEMLEDAKAAIQQDPNIQQLVKEFDAIVLEDSIEALGELA